MLFWMFLLNINHQKNLSVNILNNCDAPLIFDLYISKKIN